MAKLRRTMLYVPGNNAGMIKDAHIYRSDSVMFDLEDAVSVNEKDTARFLVYKALRTLDYEGIETVVRINSIESGFGLEDVKAIVRAKPSVIRLPKTETAEDIYEIEGLIEKEEEKCGYKKGTIGLMAAIESPLGVLNAYAIATASKRLIGIALGAEDYVTCMKTTRSPGGIELLFARSQILNAARAAEFMRLILFIQTLITKKDLSRKSNTLNSLVLTGNQLLHQDRLNLFTGSLLLQRKKSNTLKKQLKVLKRLKRKNQAL